MAAYNGHLAVLQWARAQGCPWDENTCSCAAMDGHLAVLQWAQAQGCPCPGYLQACSPGVLQALQSLNLGDVGRIPNASSLW